jgi:NTE family protein
MAIAAGEPAPGRVTAPLISCALTAFVLCGGARLGIVQVGMLEALYERRLVPDFLVGTSVGALNAAFISPRPGAIDTLTNLGRVWRSLEREDVFPVSLSSLVGGTCGRRNHLGSDGALRGLAGRYLEFEGLEDAPISLYLVAFDVTHGCELLLSRGPARDAVAASAAMPGAFPPVSMDERRLSDGLVVNNTPISHAVELGAERIYVLPTQYPCRPLEGAPKTALHAALHGLGLLSGGRGEAAVARYSGEVELVVLPGPDRAGVQPTGSEHSTALIRASWVLTRTALARDRQGRHLRVAT